MASNRSLIEEEKHLVNGTWSYGAAFNASLTPTVGPSAAAQPFDTFVLAGIIIIILLITLLLFAMAVVIDCRHQRMAKERSLPKRIAPKKSRIPVFLANASLNNDGLAFANAMCHEESTSISIVHSGESS